MEQSLFEAILFGVDTRGRRLCVSDSSARS
jgi:hypothetical protein